MRLLGRKRGDAELTCRQVGQVLQSFLDGELDTPTVEQVDRHLELCRRCGMESDVYRQIKVSLARAGGDVPELALRRLRHFGEQLTAGEHGHDGPSPGAPR